MFGSTLSVLIIFGGAWFLLGDFQLYQLGLYLVFGVAAQWVAFCWGRMGVLPLGQSLFFGLGAYLAGNFMLAYPDAMIPLHLALIICGVIPAVLAFGIAWLLFANKFESGAYFSLTTLALALLAYQAAFIFTGFTGGYDGLTGGIELPGWDVYGNLYLLLLGLLLISTFALSWIVHSPIGIIFKAISDDENRLQFFGFDTARLKSFGYALAAFFSGLAGALYAAHEGVVSPTILSVVFATELVIWCAIGGKGSVVFPVLAAVGIGLLSSEIRSSFSFWELMIAAIFVVSVIFFPNGIAGGLEKLWARIRPTFIRRARLTMSSREVELVIPRKFQNLSLKGVNVSAGGVNILNDLSFNVSQSQAQPQETTTPQIACLIGPNGAGKTSVFNAITCRLPVRGGQITLDGKPVTSNTAFSMARAGIGRKFQIPTVFGSLSVRQNLAIALWANRLGWVDALRPSTVRWSSPFLDEMCERYEFLNDLDRPAAELAQGEKQKLETIMTILTAPSLVLLDEPCAGLSSVETVEMIELISEVSTRFGIYFLVVEHDMSLVEAIASRVLVLHHGQLLAEGPFEEVRRNPDVQAVYSGGVK